MAETLPRDAEGAEDLPADVSGSPDPGGFGSVRRHLPKARQAAWNLTDQVLSAVTNMVMSILVARSVSAAGFGNFALAFLIFSLTVGVVRAVVAVPLTIRHSAETGGDRVATSRAALGAAVALAAPVSVALLVAWPLLDNDLGRTLAALGLFLPVLVVQDTCRFTFFAWGRPQLAALNDLIWAIGQFGASIVIIAMGWATPWTLVAAWGLGAGVAAVVGCGQLRAIPRVRLARSWLARHRDLTRYLVGEYVVNQGAFQGGVLVIGSALGISNLGSLRAAQTLVGPLGIISSASMTFGMPEVSRMPGLPRRTMLVATSISVALFLVGVVYAALLVLIPDSLGSALFGDTWAGAAMVLLPVAAASAIAGLKLGPVIFIYGRGLAKDSFRLVVTLAVGSVTFMVVGASLRGVVGMAWGMALAQLCVVPLWFRLLHAKTRPSRAAGPADSTQAHADRRAGAGPGQPEPRRSAPEYPEPMPGLSEGPQTPPSVDAVIVNYNYARFLADAVDSVLAQSHPFGQVIVVDDGSTDASMEVLARYGDRIRVVNIPNGGQIGASLAGLDHVTAEYAYFLDADDFAGPELCAALRDACAERPVKVQFMLAGVDEQGHPLESVFPAFPPGYSSEAMRQDNQRLGFYVCPPTSGNVYRADTLRGLPLASLAQRDSTDGTPALVMPYLGTVTTLAKVLACYRVHDASDSQQSRPVPAILSRDLERFRRRWAEAERLVPGLQAPPPGSTYFEAETDLLSQALGDRRPSVRSGLGYGRQVLGARMQARRKALLLAWTASVLAAGTESRRKLVYAKRSPVNRGGRLNSALRLVLRRDRLQQGQ